MERTKILVNQKAMTLIELLVTLSIIVVVTTMLAAILKEGFISYDRIVSEADIQLSARSQSDVIVDDIRSSKIAQIEESSYPLVMDNTKLILFTGTMEEPETVTYFLQDHNIYRQINSQTPKKIISDVQDFKVDRDEQMVTVKFEINPETEQYKEPFSKEIVLQVSPRAVLSPVLN